MSFVYVCTDNVGVVFFRKSPCQFTAKTIGFFWGDFSRSEGLPEMISNNIIGSLDLTCFAKVLLLTVNELSMNLSASLLVVDLSDIINIEKGGTVT